MWEKLLEYQVDLQGSAYFLTSTFCCRLVVIFMFLFLLFHCVSSLHLQVYPVTALTTPNLVLTLLVMVGYKNSYFQFDKLDPFFQGKHGEFTNFFSEIFVQN